MHTEDPVLQSREKVQSLPLLCICSSEHSRDVPSEPLEAPGPGCDSGKDGSTGSTTMSKSDTFQGPGGFRTPSAQNPNPQSKQRHYMDMTESTWGETRTDKESSHDTGREWRLERRETEVTEVKSKLRSNSSDWEETASVHAGSVQCEEVKKLVCPKCMLNSWYPNSKFIHCFKSLF